MGQVKIYGLKTNINKNRKKISLAIHDSITESLQFPQDKCFHRFIKMKKKDFIFPSTRSLKYIIIEIVMFTGRSKEAKHKLITSLFENLGQVGINSNDVEITIIEQPSINWGIRGFVGNELKINYNVNV